MQAGYLIVETRVDRPGFVRIHGTDHQPSLPTGPTQEPDLPRICYVASFASLDVALMHAHTALRRCTIDVEAGLYQTDPVTAIAAVDAIDLDHRPVYLNPDLAADPKLSAETERRRQRRRRINRFFNGVGVAAIILLLLKLFLGI
ncbi:hypothetical protein [Thiorhodovibrio frisius]|uniref:Uncharacterized protein n=1 Tax=Thiorhodovibrio frisius TaxID=631362 RepID=H8YWQ4_9GAMM|nr:hypothetical protein [Thiorhodovibrio frisius]EIC22880.1 hypothetical protein Thi970DRAFT_00519 [Thiorhodovibrio frisius]WPL22860.1 hypothetical protein Thiofri_03037 [Thiorhodovibrio frisius]